MKKSILAVIIAGVWISASEFFRNEILLKSYWVSHYQSLGLVFPSAPLNGAIWGVWSLMLSFAVSQLLPRYSVLKSVLLTWFMTFAMMWVVIGNMGVLPFGILLAAVPLSLLEVLVAALIIKKFSQNY